MTPTQILANMMTELAEHGWPSEATWAAACTAVGRPIPRPLVEVAGAATVPVLSLMNAKSRGFDAPPPAATRPGWDMSHEGPRHAATWTHFGGRFIVQDMTPWRGPMLRPYVIRVRQENGFVSANFLGFRSYKAADGAMKAVEQHLRRSSRQSA